MKKKIKVSIIGSGRIGLTSEFDSKRLKPASHFGMWLKNKDCELVSICDKNKSAFNKAKTLKKNIRFYEDYKKMILIEKPEIISICTWKDTHYEITKECLKLGIKVIVLEKPLANNIKQAKDLVKLVKNYKAKILVNHRRRYDEQIIKLQKEIFCKFK